MDSKLNDKVIDILEENNWRVCDYTNDGKVEIETWSPAGEDIILCLDVENFARDLQREYNDFDIDEHVERWLSARLNGDTSVPRAVELVHDAEEIERMLGTLAEQVALA